MVKNTLFTSRNEAYEKFLYSEDLLLIRKMLVLSLVLYSGFGLVDRWIEVENLAIFSMIRFYIVAPSTLVTLILSYHKSFYSLHQFVLTTLYVIAGFGVIVMLVIEPEVYSYYGGLFLVIGYGYFLLKIRWQFVTIGTVIIMIFYFALTYLYLKDYINTVLIFSIFYIAQIFISLFGSYTFSKYRLDSYLHEKNLKGDNVILEKQNYQNLKDIENSNYITIYSLAKLAESRDKFTGDHIDRVGHLCLKVAQELHSSVYTKNNCYKDEFIQSIELASTLHDIGKIMIPENILMKPGKFNDEEFEIMKKHSIFGSNTLREIQNKYSKNDFINMGIDICESHHENWDGSGYPRKLKGTDIPFSARIVAVVDVYDALISKRPYKKAWSEEESIREINKLKGIKFDKDVVEAFNKCYRTHKQRVVN